LRRALDYHCSINIVGDDDTQAEELKALGDKARDLKSRKVQQLGELVIATGADALSADELAGALVVLAETKEAGKKEIPWAGWRPAFLQNEVVQHSL
jgi:Conjugal transfer protein TraD